MNEETINTIIAYIQQYTDVSTEKLVANILQSGYKMDDIKEALRRQGISPIVIPGYVEPEPPPSKPFFTKMPVIIVVSVIGVLLIGMSAWAIISPKKQLAKQETSGTVQQAVIPETTNTPPPAIHTQTPAPSASSSATIDDPLRIFRDTFSSGDYKVTIIDTSVTTATASFSASNTVETLIAYTKHGTLVRLEELDQIMIYNDTDTYKLELSTKKYRIISNSGWGQLVQFSFIPTVLISESEINNIRWEKRSNSEWQGVWNINPNTGSYTTVTIIIDEKTHLLNKISVASPATSSTQDIEMKYEVISDIDRFLIIPSDYTKKN